MLHTKKNKVLDLRRFGKNTYTEDINEAYDAGYESGASGGGGSGTQIYGDFIERVEQIREFGITPLAIMTGVPPYWDTYEQAWKVTTEPIVTPDGTIPADRTYVDLDWIAETPWGDPWVHSSLDTFYNKIEDFYTTKNYAYGDEENKRILTILISVSDNERLGNLSNDDYRKFNELALVGLSKAPIDSPAMYFITNGVDDVAGVQYYVLLNEKWYVATAIYSD